MNKSQEIPQTMFVKEVALNDNDCCIVDLEDSQETVINHISNVYSLNEEYLKNNTKPNDDTPASILIDIDSEKDNDIKIIDNKTGQENELQHSSNKSVHDTYTLDELHKENPLLTELIEKCLNMKNNNGMLRVIYKTLIPLYKDSDVSYKKSDKLKRILIKTMANLDYFPEKKFSHIKTLCEELKKVKQKKRVELVTLKSSLNGGKFSTNKTESYSIPKKKRKVDDINEVITLDEDDDVIECESDADVQINDNRDQITEKSSPVQIVNDCETPVENDSDIRMNKQIEKIDDDVIVVGDQLDKENRTNPNSTEISNILSNTIQKKGNENRKSNLIEENNTLVERNNSEPLLTVDLSIENDEVNTNNVKTFVTPYNVKNHIARLEQRIAMCNKRIKECEEAEVCDDTVYSPYIQAEFYKSKVVSFYKEICKLMGEESVKRHKVRLKVVPGHPEGPVEHLEQFINDNIDENGEPPFPDMHDVTRCVIKANIECNLGWSKKQIENEARALFIHYGRTAQKRRQKREWRHLLSYMKEEAPDPAEVDPNLSARLSENAKVAKKNEDDLLAKYVEMENFGPDLGRLAANENRTQQGTENTLPNVPETSITNDNDMLVVNNCSGTITNNIVLYNPLNVPLQITEVPIEFSNPNGEQNSTIKPTFLLPIMNTNYNSCITSNKENNLGVNTNIEHAQLNIAVKTCFYSVTNVMHNDLNVINNVNNGAINQDVVSSTDEVKIGVSVEASNDNTDRSDSVANKTVRKEVTNLQDNSDIDSHLDLPLNNNLERANINSSKSNSVKNDAIQINEVSTNVEEPKTTNNYEGVINAEDGKNASNFDVYAKNNHAIISKSSDVNIFQNDVTNNELKVQKDLNNLDNRLNLENRKGASSFEELGDNRAYEIVFDSDEESLQTDVDTDVIVKRESDNIENRVNMKKSDIASKSRVCDIKNKHRFVFESDTEYVKTDVNKDEIVKKEANNIDDRVKTENDEVACSSESSSKSICRLTFESDVESIKTDTNNDVVNKVPNNIQSSIHTENGKIDSSENEEHSKEVSHQLDKNNCKANVDSSEAGISQINVNNDLVVKKEPLDIARMLEDLGNNYTATIIDIEDPFLVIEISDSSESEDEE